MVPGPPVSEVLGACDQGSPGPTPGILPITLQGWSRGSACNGPWGFVCTLGFPNLRQELELSTPVP